MNSSFSSFEKKIVFILLNVIYYILSFFPIFIVVILINYLATNLINKFHPSPRTWALFFFAFSSSIFLLLLTNSEEEGGIILHK